MSQQPAARLCKNGCGQEIYWDNANRYFVNVANNERHMCPNFNPRQRRDDIKQTQGYQPLQRYSQTQQPLQVESSSQREEIKAMAQEKNTIAKDTNAATRELAEALKTIATEMSLDRAQRQEFHEDFIKEGKKQDEIRE
jgi:transcriptional accessory protein Tex/SPT6